ncbi:MAG: hypothetical protein GYB66_04315 [Chloroflexi bacterium]|nr:hypothetical protein [Chloroflexota bacterium]
MFRTISRSWELVKTSFSVLRQDKEMLIFPVLSMIGLALVSIAFIVPAALAGLFEGVASDSESINPFLVVVAFLYYVVTYYITIFANAAVVGAAMMRLRGEDPTVSDAFNIAMSRAGKILGWAVIAATVGMILRAIEERAEGIGRIVVSLVGVAWNVATFLVVPVLVVENVGAIDAIKRSGSLLRQTWGEQIAGSFGVGIIFFLLFLAGGIPLILLTIGLGAIAPAAAIIGIILIVLYALALSAVGTAISGIYTAALYAYATEPQVENMYFDQDLLNDAFHQKGSRGNF